MNSRPSTALRFVLVGVCVLLLAWPSRAAQCPKSFQALHTPKRKGVTLVEMVVVTGILVGLAALSYPAVNSMLQKRKLDYAALQLKFKADAARIRAIQSGKTIELQYLAGERTYRIRESDTALVLSEHVLPEDVVFEGEAGSWSKPLHFFPNGRTASGSIEIQNPAGKNREIKVEGLLGRVLVTKPN